MNLQTFARLSLPLVAACLLFARGHAHGAEFVGGAKTRPSSSLAPAGTDISEGVNIAADVLNRRNGKRKIKLITIDDESSPAKTMGTTQ